MQAVLILFQIKDWGKGKKVRVDLAAGALALEIKRLKPIDCISTTQQHIAQSLFIRTACHTDLRVCILQQLVKRDRHSNRACFGQSAIVLRRHKLFLSYNIYGRVATSLRRASQGRGQLGTCQRPRHEFGDIGRIKEERRISVQSRLLRSETALQYCRDTVATQGK